MTNPFADLIPEKNRTTDGIATTFGYQDSEDNGVGAWGDRTNNPEIMGASLNRRELRQHFGDENKAHGAMVEVTNPDNGSRVVVPIVDKGPADWVVDRQGPTIDLTHAANQALGGTGKTRVQYRILGQNPFTDLVPEKGGMPAPPAGEMGGGDEDWQPNQNDLRPDGTKKGLGFLGALKRPDGGVSTEISTGFQIDGKERDVPLLVPTLDKSEIDYLLSTPIEDVSKANPSIFSGIAKKAIDHARQRISSGQSVYAEDQNQTGSTESNPFADLIPKSGELPTATPRIADDLGLKAWRDPQGGEEVRKAELVKLPARSDRNLEFAPSSQNDWKDAANAFSGGMADSSLQIPQGLYTQAGKAIENLGPDYATTFGPNRREYRDLRVERDRLKYFKEQEKTTNYDDRIAELEAKMQPIEQGGQKAYNESTASAIANEYNALSDKLGEVRKEYSDFYHVDEDFQKQFGGKLIAAAGAFVPQILAASLGPVGMEALQSQAFQSAWDDAKQTAERKGEAFDPKKAYAYAFTDSLQQMLLEKAGADSALAGWLEKGGAMTLKEGLKRMATGFAGEGGTEGVQGAVSDTLAGIFGIEERNPLDGQRRFDDIAIGGILSGGVSGVGAGVQGVKEAREAQFSKKINREAELVEKMKPKEKPQTFTNFADIPEMGKEKGRLQQAPQSSLSHTASVDTDFLLGKSDVSNTATGDAIEQQRMQSVKSEIEASPYAPREQGSPIEEEAPMVPPMEPEQQQAELPENPTSDAELEAMMREYQQEQQDLYDESQKSVTSEELLDAVIAGGGLPSSESDFHGQWSGELERIRESIRAQGRGGVVAGNKGMVVSKLMRKTAPDPDRLVQSLKAKGFDVDTPSDLFDLVDKRLLNGRNVYSIRTPEAAMDARYAKKGKAEPGAQLFDNASLPFNLQGEVDDTAIRQSIIDEKRKADEAKKKADGEQGVLFSQKPFTKEERQETPAKSENWLNILNAVAPGASQRLGLVIADRKQAEQMMTDIETNLSGKPSGVSIPDTAHAAIHKNVVYLFNEALGSYENQRSQGLRRMQHEIGHSWWDTLGQRDQDSLKRLWQAETKGKTGSLYTENGEVIPEAMDGVESDVQEWLGEKIAQENAAWAEGKAKATEHNGGRVSKIAAKLRGFLFDARQALFPDKSRSTIADEFRKVLKRGKGTTGGREIGSGNGRAKLVSAGNGYEERDYGNATVSGPALFAISAFHGTPHKVDRFSLDKIGTGEGAQAYGWGLYFAENPAVAEDYKNVLGINQKYKDAGISPSPRVKMYLENAIASKHSTEFLRDDLDRIKEDILPHEVAAISDFISYVEKNGYPENKGATYTVELDVEPDELLDWDKPIYDQSEAVQKLLRATNWFEYAEDQLEGLDNPDGSRLYRWLTDDYDPKEASEKLREAGIDGIKFLDAGSRSDGEGTRNFVIFDESKIKILEENGSPRFASSKPIPSTGPQVAPIIQLPLSVTKSLQGKTIRDWSNPTPNLARLWRGTADVFDNTRGLEFLGQAIRKHVDRARMYQGQMMAPFRKWHRATKASDRTQAMKEFEGYFQEQERNPTLAAQAYRLMSPAGRNLIDLWKDAANITGDINQANNMQVFDGQLNQWRPIGRVSNYFPRMVKDDILKILANPQKNPTGRDELIRDMIAAGIVPDETAANEMVNKAAQNFTANDHFGAIEKARNITLPHTAYDYSFSTAQKYLMAWAERTAQVEAFGQKVGSQGKDLFDKAQELTLDGPTKLYIKSVQDRAYGVKWDSGIGRVANTMNQLATGLQLGNPLSTIKNLLSGMTMAGAFYGTRRAMGALFDVKGAFDKIEDAYEKGVILDDLMNLLEDRGPNVKESAVTSFTNFMLEKSGFNAAEAWVRVVNMSAAQSFLRHAIKSNLKNPGSRASLQYRGFIARLGIKQVQALLDEGGAGELTDSFLRRAVNEVQGGYRYDQVPAFMDSPAGRFFFKYQKWGSQQMRAFLRHIVNPLVQFGSGGKAGVSEMIRYRDPKTGTVVTKQVPGAIMPAVRYLIILALAGGGTEELLNLLFGRPQTEASWAEIIMAMDKSKREALGMAINKLWLYHVMAGSMGQISNYAQMAMDISQRSRAKNPLEPPSLGWIKSAVDLGLNWKEQGIVTANDIDVFARSTLSAYRSGKDFTATQLNRAGADFKWAKLNQSRQDATWLRMQTARFDETIGARKAKTQIDRVGKTDQSPFRTALKEDLRVGDIQSARARVKAWLDNTPPASRKVAMAALQESVTASQPIRAGTGSGAMRGAFLQWANQNLPKESVLRIRQIDKTYRQTAIQLGLMSANEPDNSAIAAALAKFGK